MNYHSPFSESFMAILQAATKLAQQNVVPNFVNLALPDETLKQAISNFPIRGLLQYGPKAQPEGAMAVAILALSVSAGVLHSVSEPS